MAVPQEETGAGVRPRDGHVTRFYTFATTTVLPVMLVLDGSAALLAIGCGVWWYGHPARLMDEKTFITRLSCLQLLGIAGIAGAVFWTRRRHGEQAPLWRAPSVIWLIIALGFLFLAVDEVEKLHEQFDYWAHRVFRLRETAVTDRLDSVLVGAYGLLGLLLLYLFRQEIVRYGPAFPVVRLGLLLFAGMVLLDIVSDRGDVFSLFFADPRVSGRLRQWGQAIEDGMKILAEGVFLSAALACLAIARRQPPGG